MGVLPFLAVTPRPGRSPGGVVHGLGLTAAKPPPELIKCAQVSRAASATPPPFALPACLPACFHADDAAASARRRSSSGRRSAAASSASLSGSCSPWRGRPWAPQASSSDSRWRARRSRRRSQARRGVRRACGQSRPGPSGGMLLRQCSSRRANLDPLSSFPPGWPFPLLLLSFSPGGAQASTL